MLSPSSVSAGVLMAQLTPQKLLAGLLLMRWWGPLRNDRELAMEPVQIDVVDCRSCPPVLVGAADEADRPDEDVKPALAEDVNPWSPSLATLPCCAPLDVKSSSMSSLSLKRSIAEPRSAIKL